MVGKGNFGEVYVAEKKTFISKGDKLEIGKEPTQNYKLYAIKVQDKQKTIQNNLIKYTRTERNIMIKLDHPFIAQLQFAFQTKHKLFLAMNYYPGGTLKQLILKKQQIPEQIAKFYICQVFLALEALHKRNIMYRDLKPENVLLDEDGYCVLADFGLAKEINENENSTSFCGTIAYLAPEMLNRQGHNLTIDWYLMGVLFYELLVGKPPYYDSDREKLFDNINSGILYIPKKLTEETKSLLIGLLQKTPHKRLGANQDADEIKRHKFFEKINWEQILKKKIKPPCTPQYRLDKIQLDLDFLKEENSKNNDIPWIENWFYERENQKKIN